MHHGIEPLPESNPPNYKLEKAKRISRVGDYFHANVIPAVQKRFAKGFHLEIGCGHGHWLSSFARQDPNKVFVGIDLISKRIRKSELKKNRHSLDNLFFLKVEASELLLSIPEELIILSTYIMFPDPWPKKRHHKNRLIQPGFLESLAKVSSNNSKLYFRTDHNDYFEWAQNKINLSTHWKLVEPHWPHESCSFFQDLFETAHTCCATVT
ncbi:MAG: tRNA (guanosine(46)-N7)-methyltransferase TrmB [Opitutae bacterium]|nr:tRNA (guanosine(46)-N7)-methyltransferase TrmB [Opitutae bacterium]